MTTPIQKAKVACKNCNSRRVKCDRTEHAACTNCRLGGQDCEPIVSKRGKHIRHGKRSEVRPALRRSARQSQGEKSIPDVPRRFNPESNDHAHLPNVQQRRVVTGLSPAGTSIHSIGPSPRKVGSSFTNESRNEVVYYGDSVNLEYMLLELGDPFDGAPPEQSWEKSIKSLYFDQLGEPMKSWVQDVSQKEHMRLRDLGAFNATEKKTSDALIQTFFELTYPACPIIDRVEFSHKYEAGRVSPLVLQAMFFVAALHCRESLCKEAGFANRFQSAFAFYQRAKALYDANHESDAIATLQAVLLFSHWWESPMEQKDTWYWTGIAANLAQSLGLHQRRTYVGLGERQQKLWKRIWWAVYTQDITVAVLLGRTPHINDAYCNVQRLNEYDFESDEDEIENPALFGNLTLENRLYWFYLSDLCLRTNKHMMESFIARSDGPTTHTNFETLLSWEASLPEELRYRYSDISIDNGFLTSLLHLHYHTFQISLHRNSSSDPKRVAVGTVPFDAAVKIVRILEDLFSSGAFALCPLRIIPTVFAALATQIANMQQSPSNIIEVSKHRARLCMVILRKLQDIWPPVLWYYFLFLRVLRSLNCQVPDESDDTAVHRRRVEEQSSRGRLLPMESSIDTREHDEAHTHADDIFTESAPDDSISFPTMIGVFPFSNFLDDSLAEELYSPFDDTNSTLQ